MTSPSENHEPGGHEADLPAELPRALRELLAQRTADAPPAVDDLELRAAIHRHFRHSEPAVITRRRTWHTRRLATGIAAGGVAAAAALLLLLLPVLRPASLAPPGIPSDVNGDGRVDMLDAFALARGVAEGRDQPSRYDFDGNGAVDTADVDRLARRIVAIDAASLRRGMG